MKTPRILLSIPLFPVLLLFSIAAFASSEKPLVCHIGSNAGPAGETYLDDPDCVPTEENDYFCPNAGKIDLIAVPSNANHLGNPSHQWDGIPDYAPGDMGATGVGTEDTDGDGIDEGCELPPGDCPCWAAGALEFTITPDNFTVGNCGASEYPLFAAISGNGGAPVFGAAALVDVFQCFSDDGVGEPEEVMDITPEEANECIAQIAQRCADLLDPITG